MKERVRKDRGLLREGQEWLRRDHCRQELEGR